MLTDCRSYFVTRGFSRLEDVRSVPGENGWRPAWFGPKAINGRNRTGRRIRAEKLSGLERVSGAVQVRLL